MENLVTIPPIVLKHSLQTHGIFELLHQKIVDELKKIPNLLSLKLNSEMTALVSTLVENTVNKDHKIDKKKLVTQILTTAFLLSAQEILQVGHQIEFVLDNKLIKKNKKKLSSKVYNSVVNLTSGKLSTKTPK
jgi:hypothetical protein